MLLLESLRWSPPRRAAKCDHSGLALLKGSCLLARFRQRRCLNVDFFRLGGFNTPTAPSCRCFIQNGSALHVDRFCPRKCCRPLSSSILWRSVCVCACVCVLLRESRIHHRNKRSAGISTLRLKNDNNPAVTSPQPWGSRRKAQISRHTLCKSYPESKKSVSY